MCPSQSSGELRWSIKPEPLTAPNGAVVTLSVAYGPVLDEAIEVMPASALADLQATRDELRWDAERQVSLMREAAARLRPLARRAITEPGAGGDQARSDLHEAIDWLAKGCPNSNPMGNGGPCISCDGNDGYGPAPHHKPDCYFASDEDARNAA